MAADSGTSTMLATLVAVTTPATLALSAWQITGDPRLRPLGLTVDGMAEVAAPANDLLIEAQLHWSAGDGPESRAHALARQIERAFLAKGTDAWIVVLRDPEAERSYVLYRVAHNDFGPYDLADAARGVRPALDALRATRQSRGLPALDAP